MSNIYLFLKSSIYRIVIQFNHLLRNKLEYIEDKLYKGLSYQSQVNVILPFSKRKVSLSIAGEISKIIYVDGLLGYEGHSTHLWADLCKQADLILDVGAHIGLYSILAADIVPDVQIHAFEPVPDNYSLLLKNIDASSYKNRIDAHQLALSNEPGETQMVLQGSSGSTLEQDFWLNSSSLNRIIVSVDTLDSWLKKSSISISAQSLIKLDVETHEPSVLKGATDALSAGPAMLCEVLGTFTENRLNDILPLSHWRYFWIGPDGPVERRRIIGDPGWKYPNYLFMPKDSPFEEVVVNFAKK